MKKLLALCDDPAQTTGLGRVANEILQRIRKAGIFSEIWVWGVGYQGWPHDLPYKICPANPFREHLWNHPKNLDRFLDLLKEDFTHVWLMHDPSLLHGISEKFQYLCEQHSIKSSLYFPVDAEMKPEWSRILAAVDVPVAYCDYGLGEARKALVKPAEEPQPIDSKRADAVTKLVSIPHGVNAQAFHPLSQEQKKECRQKLFAGRFNENDFLIINVNSNQRRKGILQSLQLFAELKHQWKAGTPCKLYLHMRSENRHEEIDYRSLTHQLGLDETDVVFQDDLFSENIGFTDVGMNELYNASDLVITTTYGEGWGLSITEAMAAGIPVAGPDHTSVRELLGKERGILFETDGMDVLEWDNTRLRPRTHIKNAAARILEAVENPDIFLQHVSKSSQWTRNNLDWDAIAAQWQKVFFGYPERGWQSSASGQKPKLSFFKRWLG